VKVSLPAGTGVYETLAVVARRPAFLDRHLRRLERGAETLGIPKARERVEALVRAKLGTCPEAPTALRVEAPGHGIPGATMRPRVQVPPGPIVVLCGKAGKARGPADTIKHTFRAAKVTARNEAAAAGAFEALVANEKGLYAEGTITSLFAVVQGVLSTPGDDLFPLPGIARGIVLEEAARAGTPVAYRGLAEADLAGAEEVFLTNALLGVLSVDALLLADGRRVELPPRREIALALERARAEREEADRAAAIAPAEDVEGT
jgi:branched-subunit amino acid aminotransferase/4-amino-4-deoxychorismate lyase